MCTKKWILNLFLLLVNVFGFGQDTIKLKPYVENMRTVDVIIEGKKYNFLFDTGGAETLISPEIAKITDKKIYGSTTGFRMSGEIIKAQKADNILLTIGKTKISHSTVGVWDLMSILPKDFPKIDGVISLKSFAESIITIELSKNIVIIENKLSAKRKLKRKSLLATRFANGLEGTELNIFVAVPKENYLYWFLFDSGNSGPMLLSNKSAEVWNVQKENYENNLDSEFVIGGKKLKTKPFVRDIIYDGVFNFDLISKYTFMIDFQKKEVWFE